MPFLISTTSLGCAAVTADWMVGNAAVGTFNVLAAAVGASSAASTSAPSEEACVFRRIGSSFR